MNSGRWVGGSSWDKEYVWKRTVMLCTASSSDLCTESCQTLERSSSEWGDSSSTYIIYPSPPLSCCFGFQICDLGSARRLNQTVKQTTVIGTYAWMAPEVGANNHISPV